MKSLKKLSLGLLSVLVLSSIPSLATTTEFNPNYIISDEELQNWQSMNRSDIQAFLKEHGSYLEGIRTEDKEGVNRTPADIIYRASIEHEINPKYLLVKLQKEQSLITETDPTQKQMDWATGYAICDSCSMSDPTLQKNKGFGNQVDSAAGIMRWYYDHFGTEGWIKRANQTYTIDNQQIRPANNATGFLYTYTPHIHGNQNFWTLWQKWFEQRYPHGTLLKSMADSTVYLIQDDQKRPFASMTALISRFDPKMVIDTPESELNRYETGPSISLPNFAILKNGSDYYLVDYNSVRKFESYSVVQQLGYHPDEIIEVTNNDIAGFQKGTTISLNNENPLGRILKIKENSSYYFIKDNTYFPITDTQMLTINYSNFTPETVSAVALHNMEQGAPALFKDGTIFGIRGSNKIYVVEKGKKRHIATEEVFNGLGFNWNNIIWTGDLTGMYHQTAQPIYVTAGGASEPAIPIEQVEAPVENRVAQETITEPDPIVEGPTLEKEKTILDEIAELMYRTPENEVSFIGNKYETDVETYLIANYETGDILAGKNIDYARPMASFTKVMTAYRLYKEGLKTTDTYTVTYNPNKHKSDYHRFRIVEDEKIKTKDLINAMLVSSLNTPAKMLAVNVSGDEEIHFIKRMNDQADLWNLDDTHFTDTYGYDLGNVTTAKDYFTLMTNIFLEKPQVKQTLGLEEYAYDEVTDLDDKPHHFDVHSNKLVGQSGLAFDIIASKTGYLYESGSNLAMLVERKSDGKQFIVITMGNADYKNRFDAPLEITNWAISQF